jgi:hypothetical protein
VASCWSSRRWLRKQWTPGTTSTRCPSCPIVDSSSLAVVVPSAISLLTFAVQAMNLFSGRDIHNCLKGLMGMLTRSSSPLPEGMSSPSSVRLGNKCWLGAKILLGSQLLLYRIALARSQIDSKIVPHSDGHGFPPKLKWSIIRSRPISTSCVQVGTAMVALR